MALDNLMNVVRLISGGWTILVGGGGHRTINIYSSMVGAAGLHCGGKEKRERLSELNIAK